MSARLAFAIIVPLGGGEVARVDAEFTEEAGRTILAAAAAKDRARAQVAERVARNYVQAHPAASANSFVRFFGGNRAEGLAAFKRAKSCVEGSDTAPGHGSPERPVLGPEYRHDGRTEAA